MTRFYAAPENIKKNNIFIDGNEAHHILDVMRLHEGDKVVVFDGTGNEYTGFIKDVDDKGKCLTVEVVRSEKVSPELLPEVTLAQAIPKMDKMDYIVEKATELGVSRIVPLVSARTIVRLDTERGKKKRDRWKKLTITASKQCGRAHVPKIDKITDYKDMISRIDEYDLVLFAHLGDDTISLKGALSGHSHGRIIVFIGPEGDFTPEETELAQRGNCKFISLGSRVLKSDTAGLFVLSALNYEYAL